MFDVWVGDFFLLLAIPGYMVFATQLIKPKLLPGNEISLENIEILQRNYQKMYRWRLLIQRLAPLVLLIYFGLRICFWPKDVIAEGPSIIAMVIVATSVFIGSMVGCMVLRIKHEMDFVAAHPSFKDSILPVRPRIIAICPWLISLGSVLASFLVEGYWPPLFLLALAIGSLIVGLKLRYRQMSHSRFELPWDEPLGKRIAEVVERFGHTPKKLVLIPSLVTNAYALPGGTVLVTSALRTIATPEEIAAVVAHELSHVRDKEGKKWVLWKFVAAIPIEVFAIFFVIEGMGKPFEAFLPPFVGFGIITLSITSAWWLARHTRPAEFKCDADAAELGLGNDLASCLNKITRFLGQPSQWIGIDCVLLTHPSLEERTSRLLKVENK